MEFYYEGSRMIECSRMFFVLSNGAAQIWFINNKGSGLHRDLFIACTVRSSARALSFGKSLCYLSPLITYQFQLRNASAEYYVKKFQSGILLMRNISLNRREW